MKTIQVGLIGCGVMGTSLAKGISKVAGAKLAVVCDAAGAAARSLGKKMGIPATTDSCQVLARKRLDGVIIATPPFQHRALCIEAAQAGKHIFVEKPMAPSVTQCNAIIRAVREANVNLMLGHVCRYEAMHARVKQMVDEGAIGKPVYMQVFRIGGSWGPTWQKPWRLKRAKSGGLLMEINAHEIDFLRLVCGEVESVYAAGGRYLHPQQDYPDMAALTLHFASGAVGQLHTSQVSAIGAYGGRVDGTEGSLDFPKLTDPKGILYHQKWEGRPVKHIPKPPRLDPVVAELTDWVKSIQRQTTPPITGADGRAAVAIAEAAYKSIKSGVRERV